MAILSLFPLLIQLFNYNIPYPYIITLFFGKILLFTYLRTDFFKKDLTNRPPVYLPLISSNFSILIFWKLQIIHKHKNTLVRGSIRQEAGAKGFNPFAPASTFYRFTVLFKLIRYRVVWS